MAPAATDPPPLDLSDELRHRLAPLHELLHGTRPNAVVPCVGSGLSRGLKSWTELLDELIGFLPSAERTDVRAAVAQGKYLNVAGLLEKSASVGPARIQAALVRAFQAPKKPEPPIYAEVASLPTRHFLTTNYDPWLKDAVCRHLGRVPHLPLPHDGASLGHLDDERAWVFHLHGDADKPETCVLTARAYRGLLSGAPAWRRAVESLLGSRHLLFLGTSLSEPHLEVLLGEFEQAFQPTGGLRRHWWLGRPASVVETHRLEELGIEVVDYGDHSLLSPILAWLAQPEPTIGRAPRHAPAAPKPIEPDLPAPAARFGGYVAAPEPTPPLRPPTGDPSTPQGTSRVLLPASAVFKPPPPGFGPPPVMEMPSPARRFRVALSFAGEKRDLVHEVADLLARQFTRDRILYDKYHEAEFARADLGTYLPNLYIKEADLIVVVGCSRYDEKEWTGLEWRAIHNLLQQRRDVDVMLCRFQRANITGLYSGAGWVELDDRTPHETASLILERLALNEGRPRSHYTSALPSSPP